MKTISTPPARQQLGLLVEYYDSRNKSTFGKYLGSEAVPVGTVLFLSLAEQQGIGTERRQVVEVLHPREIKRSFSKVCTLKPGKYIRVISPLEGKEIR